MMQCLGTNILGILLHFAALTKALNSDQRLNVGRSGVNFDDQYTNREEQTLHQNYYHSHERIKRTMAEQPPFLQNTPAHGSSPLSILTSSSSSSSRTRTSSTMTTSRNPSFGEILTQLIDSAEDDGDSPPARVSPERLALSSSSLSLSTSRSSEATSGVPCAYCVRRARQETIGYDTRGNEIHLDIGTCRKRVRKKYRGQDSSSGRCTTCGQSYMCVPHSSRMERAHLPTGSSEHRVIVNCSCRERSPPRCTRRSHIVTFSPNSRFETAIDVGMCEGGCPGDSGSTGCRPITNKTVAFRDPNGARTVEIIQDCACATPCYRATHMESVYALKWNASANQTQVMSVDLDVGKCVGTCPLTEHCVIQADDGSCLMALTVPSSSCHAKSRQEHTFILPNGNPQTIYSITDCSCPAPVKT